jgi:peptidoglycan/xylan/chitin deacetylase (PgdA/CDA1 family)
MVVAVTLSVLATGKLGKRSSQGGDMNNFNDRGAPRPPIKLPNGERVCVTIDIAYEGFLKACQYRHRTTPLEKPDLFSMSFSEYGPRVGVWRLMETFDEFNVKCTSITSGLAAQRYPKTLKALHAAGHEIMGHAWTNDGSSIASDDEKIEQDEVRRSLDAIIAATGERPVGWMSPGGMGSPARTKALVEAGVIYNCDDASDDLPFVVQAHGKPHVVFPRTIGGNDLGNWLAPSNPPSAFYDSVKNQFDWHYAEGTRGRPGCMDITLHCHMAARPPLMPIVRELLRYIQGHPGVWIAKKCDVAQWILDHPEYHG